MNILIIILSHNAYTKHLEAIYNRALEFDLPKNVTTEIVVVTENTENEVIDECKRLSVKYKTHNVNNTKLSKFKNPLRLKNAFVKWPFDKLYKVSEIRNYYLTLTKDWLCHIDGDVLPPKDGLKKLIEADKDHIGALVSGDWYKYAVSPRPEDQEEIYECEVIGGCFCLESPGIVKIPYRMIDGILTSDAIPRCEDIIKAGFKNYCHQGIVCEHLK